LEEVVLVFDSCRGVRAEYLAQATTGRFPRPVEVEGAGYGCIKTNTASSLGLIVEVLPVINHNLPLIDEDHDSQQHLRSSVTSLAYQSLATGTQPTYIPPLLVSHPIHESRVWPTDISSEASKS
jgi:hypothetical protein